jgi:hypothetical protein
MSAMLGLGFCFILFYENQAFPSLVLYNSLMEPTVMFFFLVVWGLNSGPCLSPNTDIYITIKTLFPSEKRRLSCHSAAENPRVREGSSAFHTQGVLTHIFALLSRLNGAM